MGGFPPPGGERALSLSCCQGIGGTLCSGSKWSWCLLSPLRSPSPPLPEPDVLASLCSAQSNKSFFLFPSPQRRWNSSSSYPKYEISPLLFPMRHRKTFLPLRCVGDFPFFTSRVYKRGIRVASSPVKRALSFCDFQNARKWRKRLSLLVRMGKFFIEGWCSLPPPVFPS